MTKQQVDERALIIIIHGESGAGKSPIGQTTPAPRLVLDVENGSRFVRGRKTYWDPSSGAPPTHDDTWDTCVIRCRDYSTFDLAMRWLVSGQHPFKSVTIDSLSELQKRCKDTLVTADETADQRTWGLLLSKMEKAVRDLRDLTVHPTNALRCVCILALTDEIKGKFRPMVQGRLALSLPGLVDTIGYLYVQPDETGRLAAEQRVMLVQPVEGFVAKDRTSELSSGGIVGVFGPRVSGPIDLTNVIDKIYQEA